MKILGQMLLSVPIIFVFGLCWFIHGWLFAVVVFASAGFIIACVFLGFHLIDRATARPQTPKRNELQKAHKLTKKEIEERAIKS